MSNKSQIAGRILGKVVRLPFKVAFEILKGTCNLASEFVGNVNKERSNMLQNNSRKEIQDIARNKNGTVSQEKRFAACKILLEVKEMKDNQKTRSKN